MLQERIHTSHNKQSGRKRFNELIKSSSTEMKPLVSIITVVYNGVAFLEDTIFSIINQTYCNIEYIIIDGGSTDGTLDIIKKYESKIDYWVSEPDGGIYDAMNKGIDLATGDWINFMNAGDSFIDINVINNVFQYSSDADVIFGDTKNKYDLNNIKYVKAGKLSDFYKGMPFCHQSVFVSAQLMRQRKFNTKYKICADFDFLFNAFYDRKKFVYIPLVIALYDATGLSSQSIMVMWRENREIVSSRNIIYRFYFYLIYPLSLIRFFLKKFLPKNIVKMIQMYK